MELQVATLNDEKIVALYWQRDELAIKETDRKYGKFLLAIANNIVHNLRDNEECLSDTYIGAWNAMPPAKPVFLQSFLATIMRRIAINRFHANNCQKRVASEFSVSLSELEDFIADESNVETQIETKELGKIISDFVRALPDRQMYIFISRYYIADPILTISKELGCSVSTVKRELEAIKKGLKKRLESEGYI